MTQPNNLDVSKKLSPESIRLLEEITELSIRGADLVPRLYSSLSKDGLPHKEILYLIEERLDIGRRRLYQLLEPQQKRSFTKTKVKQIALSKESNIAAPAQVVQELEIIPEQQPSKPITDKQTFILDPKTCKGWPCEKVYIYEVECKDGIAVRMYSI